MERKNILRGLAALGAGFVGTTALLELSNQGTGQAEAALPPEPKAEAIKVDSAFPEHLEGRYSDCRLISPTTDSLIRGSSVEVAAPCVLNAWFEPALPARITTTEWVEGTLHLQNILLTPLATQTTFSATQGEIRFSPVAFAVRLAPEETFKEDFRFQVDSQGEFSFNAEVIRQDDRAVCKTLSHSGVAMTLRRVFLPFVSRELQAPIPTPTPGPIVTPPPP